jgi:hypothetical protein
LVRVAGDPCFLDFLEDGPWLAHAIGSGGADPQRLQEVSPQLAHVEALQWSNFLDFRIRYGLIGAEEGPEAFLNALRDPGEMEVFFSERASNLYLENRVAGACFSESRSKLDPASPIRRSMPLAASALQWGLIKNLDRAAAVLESGCWAGLERDREAAIRVGLADPAVKKRVETVLHLAEEGLPEEDRWALSYAWDVLLTGRSNADRALETVASDGIVGLIRARLLVD